MATTQPTEDSRSRDRSNAGLDRQVAAGRALLCQGRITDALAAADTVLSAAPAHSAAQAAAHFLRGEARFLLREAEAALACYRDAMGCGLSDDPAAFQAAMSGAVPGDFGWFAAMLLGRFEEAWQISDRSLRQRLMAGRDDGHLPRHLRSVWRGEPLAGRTILVRCNHGLGDAIQFIRYIPLLRRQAARVLVEAPLELHGLFSSLSGIDRLLALDEAPEVFCDVEIELAELLHAFRTTLDTIPADVPYLAVDTERIVAQRRRLQRLAGTATRLRIGVAWAAGAWRPDRSLPPALLEPLAGIPGVALVSLQRGAEQPGLEPAQAPPMIDAGRQSTDTVETAAIIQNLDLVISVDTMVAHLAGALGARTWVLLHHAADWRWLLAGARSPWYPTMRLFRQPAPGDWEAVVAAVAERLAGVMRNRA